MGVNPKTLKIHPRVNALIEQRKSPSPSKGGQARRNEEEVLSDVQHVISLLTERSASINYVAIAREMGGITAQTLRTHPKVRMLVDEYLQSDHLYQLQQFALREEQLLCQLETAITEMEALGKPFTQCQLCEKVGKSRSTLRRYPRVNALLQQKVTRHHYYQRRRDQRGEEDLVQHVKEAIIDLSGRGELITQRKVARKVKISQEVLMQYPPTLFHYPPVRALMTQATNEDKQQRRERRFQVQEEELTQQVVAALQQLRDQNRRITKRAIEKAVHVSNICLHYPKVRVLIESAITAQRTASKSEQD